MSDVGSLQDDDYCLEVLNHSPLLYIDTSVLSEASPRPQTTTNVNNENLKLRKDTVIIDDFVPMTSLSSMQDKGSFEERFKQGDYNCSDQSFDTLRLLYLPDESLGNFSYPDSDLPCFAQRVCSPAYNSVHAIDDNFSNNVCLSLQFSPQVGAAFVDAPASSATELPLLHFDFNHPVFFDEISATRSAAEPKKQLAATEVGIEDCRVSYAEGARKRRREAKQGILPCSEKRVFKTVETQTDNNHDDSHGLSSVSDMGLTENEDVNAFRPSETSKDLISDKEVPERPVSEWSPSVAAFYRQVEDVETEMADKQLEGGTDIHSQCRGHGWPLWHKGLSAAEIEMMPIHKDVNQVSAAVQTDKMVQDESFSKEQIAIVRDIETQVCMKDASTQSQHIDQDISVIGDSVTEDEVVDSSDLKPVASSGDKVESEGHTSLSTDLPQVLAPHLFFGLKFAHGNEDDTMRGDRDFISVVDIPASSLNDLPSVDTNPQKEIVSEVLMEKPGEGRQREGEHYDTASAKSSGKGTLDLVRDSDENQVLQIGDGVTTYVFGEEPTNST